MKRALLLATSIASIIACGRHSKHDSALPPPIGNLGLTGAAQKAQLATWVAAPLKTCDAQSIFAGTPASGAQGIDSAWLYTKLSGRLEIKSADGASYAALASPYGSGTQSETHYETEQEVNGVKASLRTSTKSNGLRCDVYADDTLVQTSFIYAGLTVVDAFHAEKKRPDPINIYRNTGTSRRTDLASIEDFISKALEPDEDDLKFVREYLGLATPADTLITGRSSGFGSSSYAAQPLYTFPDVPSLPPALTSSGSSGAVGSLAEMQELHPLATKYDRVYRRALASEVFPAGTIGNEPQPLGLRRTDVSLSFSASAATIEGVSIAKLSSIDPLVASVDDGLACAEGRFARLGNIAGIVPGSPLQIGQPYPTAAGVLDPCEVLRVGLINDLATTTRGLAFFRGIFLDTVGTKERSRYFGWDDVFFRTVSGALARGQDLAPALDPDHKVPLLTKTQLANDKVKAAVAAHPAPTVFDGSERNLGITWSLRALDPSDATIDSIISAAANLADPFAPAAKRLLEKARDPAAAASLLDYARTLPEDVKVLARTAIAAAAGARAESYVNDLVASVVEKKIDAARWTEVNATLAALKPFIDNDRARLVGNSGALFDFDLAIDNLVDAALDEAWSTADFVGLESLANVARLDTFCDTKRSTTAAMTCYDSSMLSKKGGKHLDPAFGGRYTALSADIVAAVGRLDATAFYSQRRSIVQSFREPLWHSCDGARFESKRKELLDITTKLPQADFPARFDLERQLRDTLEDCPAR